ncbi:cyclin-dependent kinase F-4 [Eucalyptus grandis]|uniref:cyclin-dependent kinase F-4 n=1 Tax=Eucalyptus grandis TaxID=71139 RepID=UPI00192EBE36|nr:cyclin-dependent kinase F-4 [Eucalyptus grandis]XP_018729878.2 cyclin-dependent kinase F-4 [Eucalyptus grandis]
MERYELLKEVGDGTFGNVWRAINKHTGEVVAIKKMKRKYYSREECVNLREVKSLQKMNHPSIVKLKELIWENNILYFVFEYMECNLYHLMKDREKLFSEAEIRNWFFQVFQGLAYMHHHGYFHRDLKPENLLKTKDTVKIADFGLAREINSDPPYTEYVSTRWYRAPEVLLQSHLYGSKVDMWAMGAIMAEMFTLRPLFPGISEADEVFKICGVIGSPTWESWADGLHLARSINYQFPQFPGVNLSRMIPSASADAINLIRSLCSWNPFQRPGAAEALQHPFFQSCYYIPPALRSRLTANRTPPPVGTRVSLQVQNGRRYPGMSDNRKLGVNNSSPRAVALKPGAQRKLNMVNQDSNKVAPYSNSSVKQPRFRPSGNNSPTSVIKGPMSREVADISEKLADMSFGPRKGPEMQQLLPLKAGGWRDEPVHAYYGQRHGQWIQPGRGYNRKVAG